MSTEFENAGRKIVLGLPIFYLCAFIYCCLGKEILMEVKLNLACER